MRIVLTTRVAILAALGICISVAGANASESDKLRAETKQIERANAALNHVYQEILTVLDGRIKAGDPGAANFKGALVEAERIWIKWRDAEALMRAYSSGAVGGSALIEDLHSNLIRLIEDRRTLLQNLLR